MLPPFAQLDRARRLLCTLQNAIRDTLLAARLRGARRFTEVAAVTAADTIYHVDRLGEAAILAWFEEHWPRTWPIELVMEGIEDADTVTFPRGTPVAKTRWKCILDPIDGTRGWACDKRNAWVLTALAPQRGARTTLADIVVAAMTELPTTKQWRSDQLSAVRGCGPRGIVARSRDVRGSGTRPLALRLSTATDFTHGFASVVRFFPEGKALTAQIEETLWQTLYGAGSEISRTEGPAIFEDQYLSTGGQVYEIMAGHDRMICDIRPYVMKKLGIVTSRVCHPYDICTELILREAGGLVETPKGEPLRTRLDTTSAVAWVGYANASLATQVRPVLRRLLATML